MAETRSSNKAPTYRVPARVVTAAIFGLIVFGTAIASLAGVRVDAGVSENRALSTLQPPTAANLLNRGYFQTINNWANDHQALRAPLVGIASATKLYAFNAPLNDKTLIGQDGFYFYGLKSMRRDFERLDRFEDKPAYVREVLSLLRGLEAWSEQTGRRVLFMVAPNKHNIYPEKYHPFYTHGTGPGTGETLEKWLDRALPSMAVPVADVLRTAARDKLIYYRTDTHWNPLGAKIAADQVAERLKTVAPMLPVAAVTSTWIEKTETMSAGNFADLLSLPIAETVPRPEPEGGFKAVDDVSAREKLASLLPGRTRLFEVKHNAAAASAPKLLMLGDSFMTALVPYLAEQFSSSVFYNPFGGPNTPDERFPQQLIEAVNPDVVLVQLVERRIRPCAAKKKRARKCADMLIGDVAGNIFDMRLAKLARDAIVLTETVAPSTTGKKTWTIDTASPLPEGRRLMVRARTQSSLAGLKLAAKSTPVELRGTYDGLDAAKDERERLYLAQPDPKTGKVFFSAPETLDPAAVVFDVLSVPDDTDPQSIPDGPVPARQMTSKSN
jgi:hypothetical protein